MRCAPTVIAAQGSNKYALFEASNVYKVRGGNRYLLIVEAIGSDGGRYFRSWTSGSIAGSWTPLAESESNPLARATNVTFPASAWSCRSRTRQPRENSGTIRHGSPPLPPGANIYQHEYAGPGRPGCVEEARPLAWAEETRRTNHADRHAEGHGVACGRCDRST